MSPIKLPPNLLSFLGAAVSKDNHHASIHIVVVQFNILNNRMISEIFLKLSRQLNSWFKEEEEIR